MFDVFADPSMISEDKKMTNMMETNLHFTPSDDDLDGAEVGGGYDVEVDGGVCDENFGT